MAARSFEQPPCPSTSSGRGEMLTDHRCRWKARLILSEVEGSGPIFILYDAFARTAGARRRSRIDVTVSIACSVSNRAAASVAARDFAVQSLNFVQSSARLSGTLKWPRAERISRLF